MKIEPDNGFTLVEVLVALALMGSVFALVASAWMAMSSGRNRVEAGYDQLLEASVRRSLIQTHWAAALPWLERDNAETALRFVGRPDRLEYVAARPEFEDGSAYRLWRWRLVEERAESLLEVAQTDFRVNSINRDAEPEWREMLRFDRQASFLYLKIEDDENSWLTEWDEEAKELPKAILLDIPNRPPVVVDLRLRVPAACAGQVGTENEDCP